MFQKAALLAFVTAAITPVFAQVGEWGQCGGINYSGSTTCQSPYVCTVLNDYYYQCLPGSSSGTVASSSSTSHSTTSSSHSTTSSSHSTTSSSSKSSTSTSTKPTTTSSSTSKSSTSTSSSSTTSVSSIPPVPGNPYTGRSVYASPYYAAEIAAAAATISNSTLVDLYNQVAKVPTFTWLDTVSKVPTLGTYLADAGSKNEILQIVVYDLPDRDCAAQASNGEFSIANGGQALYFNYIDQIVEQISQYPDTTVVAVVEPDSLANLVTNLSVQKCANAKTTYLACVTYAIQQLSTVNVHMYLDAGHAGWLGWPANLQPAAQLFNSLYTSAGSPSGVRGLATNVANYNSIQTNSPDPATQGDPNYDELLYIQALAPYLTQYPAHFIIDQGRSGQQNLRVKWGDWCNIKGAGFGIRPTTSTPSPLIDAIVWVKPGGECDGTSDSSSPRYDPTCSLSDADQPAPEAGTWFQEYFNTLVLRANPPFSP